MAVLSAPERTEILQSYMADFSRRHDSFAGLTKTQLALAVDNLDNEFDAILITLNNALPLAVRLALTARQKAELASKILRKRFEVTP